MASGVFRKGDLRLYLLGALEAGSKHGYELMRLLEERFAGLYRPSAGSIYPRLTALVAAGLVTQDGRDYALTDEGRAEVEARRDELRALDQSIVAGTPRRRSGQELRAEVRAAAAELRAQQRRVNRERRDRVSNRTASLESLRVELRVFAADVMSAARRAEADTDAIARATRALDGARVAMLDALARRD